MQYYLAVWSSLFGLVIGSFLNVVIYRLPRHESLISPGSHCPGCGVAIRWFDNIPVASWLLLRGLCRTCRSPISIRYPLIESLTGVAFLTAYLRIGVSAATLLAWALIAVLVTFAFIYHDHGIIPGRVVFFSALCGLGAAVALDPKRWWYYLAGSAGAGLLALGLASVDSRHTNLSQAKVAVLLGAVFGPWTLAALPLAAILRVMTGLTLVFWQKSRLRARTVVAPYPTDGDTR